LTKQSTFSHTPAEPERGLEPLTYRLQGDTTVRLKPPVCLQNHVLLVGVGKLVFG